MSPPLHTAPRPRGRPLSALRNVLVGESGGGLILMASAALALAVANSPWAGAYFAGLKAYVGPLSVLHWINDALMAVFFLLVGLEIKREVLDGRLRTWPDRVLPGLAALGGMLAPALVYAAVNWGSPGTMRGWAIPTATDIAFALGVLALLGSRVPVSLKVFLTALAIIDDLGAVVIIAAFYTADLSLPMLAGAAATLAALIALNKAGVARLAPYLLLGAVLWAFVLLSGIHATIAGVLLALTVPLRLSAGKPDDPTSPLHILEHAVHPWSAYLILPVFGFANAGVSLAGITPRMLLDPVTLGVALGLFVGKQAGVFGLVFAAVKLGLAQRPAHASWRQVYGMSLLCGVGFTMSLFIGMLAFPDAPGLEERTKVGVLLGSLACMAAGAMVLRFSPGHTATHRTGPVLPTAPGEARTTRRVSVSVRTAVTGDHAALADLHAELHAFHVAGRPDLFRPSTSAQILDRADFERDVASGGHVYIVAEAEGLLVGFVLLVVEDMPGWSAMARTAEIDRLGVTEGWRGRGIGKALLRAAEAMAAERGAGRVFLGVHAFNEGARRFYASAGFSVETYKLAKRMGMPGQ